MTSSVLSTLVCKAVSAAVCWAKAVLLGVAVAEDVITR